MGGIVSADVLLSIIDEPTVSGKGDRMMFPYIQGILAFDTPFLGLAPGMFAHNVDAKVKTAGELVKQVGAIAGGLWGGLRAGEEASGRNDGETAVATRIPAEGAKAREEKESRRESRGSRSERGERSEKKERSERSERGERSERKERSERGEKSERSERSERKHSERKDSDRSEKSERRHSERRDSERSERSERKHSERKDSERSEKSERRHSERRDSERSSKSERSERPIRSESFNTLGTSRDRQQSPEPETPAATPAIPAWQRWKKLALITGAVGALAAGTAAGYYKREEISQGFGWVSSHFEFVAELYKSETLATRLTRASSIRGVGFANFYTSLGLRRANSAGGGNMAAPPGAASAVQTFLGGERTFCSEPQKDSARRGWYKTVNNKAKDEIGAHTGLFSPGTNPEFYKMRDHARDLVVQWVEGWN